MGEVTKLVTCLILVFFEQEQNAFKFGRALRKTIIDNKMDTLKGRSLKSANFSKI